MRRAVRRRLMSDVPVGFFLSGGIDSSLTTALAAEVAPSPVKTFTLTYMRPIDDRRKGGGPSLGAMGGERYGTEHHEETIAVANIRRVSGRSCAHSTSRSLALCQPTSCPSASRSTSRLRLRATAPTSCSAATAPIASRPKRGAARRRTSEPDWEWRARLLVMSDEEKPALYSPDVRSALNGVSTREHLRQAFEHADGRDPLNRMLEAEFRGIFPDQVLTFVDRLSMAHSLEVRSAFLDTDVVEYVAAPSRLAEDP